MAGDTPKRPDWIGEPIDVPAVAERRSLAPSEVSRAPWADGGVRTLNGPEVTSGEPTATVWLEHHEHQGLAFRLEVDADGALVSFYVRPLAFVGEYAADGSVIAEGADVDEHGLPDGAPRLTATTLRQVPLGTLHRAAVASLGRMSQLVPVVEPEPVEVQQWRRHSTVSDVELAELARDYVDMVARGVRSTNVDLAADRGESPQWVADRLRLARRRGLLEYPPEGAAGRRGGRPGGRLTDRARALLSDA